ncbi:MAG: ATP-binding cassette domain-containing protein [Desulfobacterales bacterium]|nr:ATP-binding cassette domain-containing protein [Desulfobacterales bacterium]
MLYRLSGVTKVYEDRTVLDIPDMNIEAGERYALLGPNGAGKTTLLNILAFLDRPTAGAVEFESSPVDFSRKGLQALRRKVVMVDQHPILFTRTVFQNVAYGMKIRKIPAKERKTRVADALERVGMTAFAGAMAHRLSGGETQRVALARALALSPSVLLCDEPAASVDAEHQSAIIRILKEINEAGKISLIFTSHDRSQAVALATKTIYLDQGRPVSSGYENVFTAALASGKDGRAVCQIENGPRITLPYDGVSVTPRKVRLEIDPRLLILGSPAGGRTSENRFPGKVIQATEEGGHIRCVIDIGIWIGVALSESTYRKISPLIGDRVSVQIPADAVRLI